MPTSLTALVLIVFALVYVGMAAGRVPGLRVDRVGIALIGAVVVVAAGALNPAQALAAVDFPTLFVLFGLMILSAQFAEAGFTDWCSQKVAASPASPERLLALTVAVGGGLSAVLANDVVVFAMTPLLCAGLERRGLDPRPYVIALAGAANAGSAATLIGNPQNILIGQAGGLNFWEFLAVCGPPAVVALAVTYGVVAWIWRGRLHLAAPVRPPEVAARPLDRAMLLKGLAATVLLLALFSTPLPHAAGALVVAAVLLVSRRLATRTALGLVDWPLLVLFAALFVVTGALAATGLPDRAVAALADAGLAPDGLGTLAALTLIGSNTIGNVPADMLLLAALPDLGERSLQALALLSTLAGNLLLTGSLANIIAVERAASVGVRVSFLDHARCGVPMTLLSLAVALAWLAAV
ncbi:SLC13 family permease [Novispirillum sp. DQ9]|uniref:SLC13 family permease n=1 Tax=Novispirillum sp. DQ9 TaxID=3398612 RepID=UPI003C7E7C3C